MSSQPIFGTRFTLASGDSNAFSPLDIIPITLAQFKKVFEALFESGQVDVALVRELLEQCGSLHPVHEALAWK